MRTCNLLQAGSVVPEADDESKVKRKEMSCTYARALHTGLEYATRFDVWGIGRRNLATEGRWLNEGCPMEGAGRSIINDDD